MRAPPPACPSCGRSFGSSLLGDLCPACLMDGLLEEEPASTAGGMLSIPGYEVLEELGRGGMGVVYRARQWDPPREVALKMLLPVQSHSPAMRDRFRLEASTVAALDHPHILPVYAVGEHDGLPWFTLKLVKGGTLAERNERFADQWREIVLLLVTLAEAVHFAHQRGVLHRDLKPGNILFDEADRVYVGDFGLAKWLDAGMRGKHAATLEGMAMGTPHYLPPESAKHGAGAATAASDQYSLGAVFYELLTGRPPFMADSTPELVRMIYEETPVSLTKLNPAVPADLAAVAMKCLEKDPGHRYPSVGDLAVDLQSWLDGRGVRARPVPAGVRLVRWARRNPALSAVTGLLLGALAAGAVLQIRAYGHLQTALAESLLNQARLTAVNRSQGARDTTLQLLRQMDGTGASREPALEARRASELAHALAMPELSQTNIWVAPSPSAQSSEGFSSDLSQYLAATMEGGFALHDTASRQVLRTWPALKENPEAGEIPAGESSEPHGAVALGFQLSPDGRHAAVVFGGPAGFDGELQIIRLEDGRVVSRWRGVQRGRQFPVWLREGGWIFGNGRIPCEAVSADGSRMAFPTSPGNTGVVPLVMHPDGSKLAVMRPGGRRLEVLKYPEGTLVWQKEFRELPGPVNWSPDGLLLAAGEQIPATRMEENPLTATGCGILLYSAETGELRAELPGHALAVAQMIFLGGSRSIASTGGDQGLVWQETRPDGFRLTAPAQPRLLQADATGQRLAWSPVEGSLAIAEVRWPVGWHVWDNGSGSEATCSATSPQGNRLFLSTRTDLQIWDATKGLLLHRQNWPAAFPGNWPWFVTAQDGRSLIVGELAQPLHQIPLPGGSSPEEVSASGPAEAVGPDRTFYMIHSISPDGSWVVCDAPSGREVQRNRTFSLWPGGDHRQARVVAREVSASTMFLMGPESRWALSAARHGRDCAIWDVANARQSGTVGLDEALGLSASRDGRWAALAGRSQLAVWDPVTRKIHASWAAPPGTGGTLGRFSPDHQWLAVPDRSGSIHLFHLRRKVAGPVLVVPGGFPLRDIQWAGNRKILAMGRDGRIGGWDLDQLQQAAAAAGLRADGLP